MMQAIFSTPTVSDMDNLIKEFFEALPIPSLFAVKEDQLVLFM